MFLDNKIGEITSKDKIDKGDKGDKGDKVTKQLTVNQIVLLLLKLDFFDNSKIVNTTKVNQAKLISLITNFHEKNIKTNIQKLDKPQSLNGPNYQKDIDKVNKILEDLN